MNCKNCKHCHEYRSLVTEAYGGFSYQCDLGKGHNGMTVGHHDYIYNKDYFRDYKKYVKNCKEFEPKLTIWKKRKETKFTFLLENDDYIVQGGNKDTCQLFDKTWFSIKIKKTPNKGRLYYSDNKYEYRISEDLENEIIEKIKEVIK